MIYDAVLTLPRTCGSLLAGCKPHILRGVCNTFSFIDLHSVTILAMEEACKYYKIIVNVKNIKPGNIILIKVCCLNYFTNDTLVVDMISIC